MLRTIAVTGLLALMIQVNSGCCVNRHLDCGGLDTCCGSLSDPILGDCSRCGVCGGSDCPGYTPCGYLKYMLTCGSGCGEIYYNEWISDPPDCCDPCDDCGNWCQGCGTHRRRLVIDGVRDLIAGLRTVSCLATCDGTDCGSGCRGCGRLGRRQRGFDDFYEDLDTPVEVLDEPLTAPGEKTPRPAQRPSLSTPEHKASRPGAATRVISASRSENVSRDPSLR